MSPLGPLLAVCLVALSQAVPQRCYDQQVAQDQFFDDSFVCNENIPHPHDLIENDLSLTQDLDVLFFLDTATSCFNETGYFTRSESVTGDYAYSCVCNSPRKRIEKVYVQKDICFVVYPEKQDIQYAQCGGHCSFDYGTEIATESRGYYCVHQSFVQREFMVWCPKASLAAGLAASASGAHAHAHRVARAAPVPIQRPGQMFGTFHRVQQTLPTLCSCRGYFCDNHNAIVPAVGL